MVEWVQCSLPLMLLTIIDTLLIERNGGGVHKRAHQQRNGQIGHINVALEEIRSAELSIGGDQHKSVMILMHDSHGIMRTRHGSESIVGIFVDSAIGKKID